MKSLLLSERLVSIVARKKIVFVIVEGPSDQDALAVILSRIYSSNEVYVHVVHGDITTQFNETPQENIFTKVAGEINHYASNNHLNKDDFKEIIHIVDTDGTYVPDVCVVEDKNATEPIYSLNEIRTKNKTGIESRNKRKSTNINKLCSKQSIWNVPYRVYYMSCNLDHVLYNQLNCSDEEKGINSFKFAKTYKDKIPEFLQFIGKSDFSVTSNYKDSWDFIKQGKNSLNRYTNLGICFQPKDD